MDYYRQRISAFYRHYQPDKPVSHVEFLLCKYKGMEEDVLSTLREKYGPEPSVDDSAGTKKPTIGVFKDKPTGGGAALSSTSNLALDEGNSSLSALLEEKMGVFQRDMWLLQEQSRRAEAAAIGVSLQDARRFAQKQEVELQQLRHTLSALKAENAARAESQKDAIEKASRELTLAKLRHMQASMSANGQLVPFEELAAAQENITQIDENLKGTVEYGRKLVTVLQRHLFLYPMSPVRMTLEELDPSIAARLEMNMSISQQHHQAATSGMRTG